MSDILDKMRQQVKNSGGNRKGMLILKEGEKEKVRFLTDMREAVEFKLHEKYGSFMPMLCQAHVNRECTKCDSDDDKVRDTQYFCWQVYNYDSKKVELMMYKANEQSPVPHMIAFFDEYGTLTDRDYTIKQSGKGKSRIFSLLPGEKKKFKKDAQLVSSKNVLKRVYKAYPKPSKEDEDEDND